MTLEQNELLLYCLKSVVLSGIVYGIPYCETIHTKILVVYHPSVNLLATKKSQSIITFLLFFEKFRNVLYRNMYGM